MEKLVDKKMEEYEVSVVDWKGNEVKAGMTIYFVQTEPMIKGRMGMYIPKGDGTYDEVWESEEDADKRNNTKYWFLGQEYLVVENEHGMLFQTMPDEEGYTWAFPFSFRDGSIIAIKGISDKKE